mmetsp:Transcript_8746/g.20338  ORF Transcript_8746/g.20338 Transcript_8746/m.20338 type:complete len:398 (+) Transcript_8746:645-1838(+)
MPGAAPDGSSAAAEPICPGPPLPPLAPLPGTTAGGAELVFPGPPPPPPNPILGGCRGGVPVCPPPHLPPPPPPLDTASGGAEPVCLVPLPPPPLPDTSSGGGEPVYPATPLSPPPLPLPPSDTASGDGEPVCPVTVTPPPSDTPDTATGGREAVCPAAPPPAAPPAAPPVAPVAPAAAAPAAAGCGRVPPIFCPMKCANSSVWVRRKLMRFCCRTRSRSASSCFLRSRNSRVSFFDRLRSNTLTAIPCADRIAARSRRHTMPDSRASFFARIAKSRDVFSVARASFRKRFWHICTHFFASICCCDVNLFKSRNFWPICFITAAHPVRRSMLRGPLPKGTSSPRKMSRFGFPERAFFTPAGATDEEACAPSSSSELSPMPCPRKVNLVKSGGGSSNCG